jgi:hypothetical protein
MVLEVVGDDEEAAIEREARAKMIDESIVTWCCPRREQLGLLKLYRILGSAVLYQDHSNRTTGSTVYLLENFRHPSIKKSSFMCHPV